MIKQVPKSSVLMCDRYIWSHLIYCFLKYNRIYFWASIFLHCPLLVFSQQKYSLLNPTTQLKNYFNNHPVEKVYLQFDKPYYAAGDTIYFKSYTTSGERNILSGLSKVLYADLRNENHTLITSLTLAIRNGISQGDFVLPDTLKRGVYTIQAYTKWMQDEDPENRFHLNFWVDNLSAVPAKNKPGYLLPDIQFMPEGGALISGVKCKVAFKATKADGTGVNATGTVLDNNNHIVANFQTAHQGMGYFYLTPLPGQQYFVNVQFADRITHRINLPIATAAGIALSIINDSIPKATIKIEATTDFYLKNKNKPFEVLIYNGGKATTVLFNLDSTIVKFDLLKRKLLTGITTITLFSPEYEPLCKRLLFVQNFGWLNASIQDFKPIYSPQENMAIQLHIANRSGDAIENGNFSVSVINESNIPFNENKENSILASLLLTQDLTGDVEDPNYYFTDIDEIRLKNLDLVMLTHGYRTFTWKRVLGETLPVQHQPELGLAVKGQLKTLGNKSVSNGDVSMYATQGGQVFSVKTDSSGYFAFNGLSFTDTAKFVLNAKSAKGGDNVKVIIFNERSAMSSPLTINLTPFPDTLLTSTYLKSFSTVRKQEQAHRNRGGTTLKQVDITARKVDNNYFTSSRAGAGNADQVMHNDELQKVGGPMTSSLMGRLKFIQWIGQPGLETPYYHGAPVLIVIDGIESPPGGLTTLIASQVETIEFLKGANALIYPNGSNGVIVATSKHAQGITHALTPKDGILPITLKGFYKAKEFYTPKYDAVPSPYTGNQYRSTIWWQPHAITNFNGNCIINYLNGTEIGNYRITIEGVDNKGNLLHQIFKYTVACK